MTLSYRTLDDLAPALAVLDPSVKMTSWGELEWDGQLAAVRNQYYTSYLMVRDTPAGLRLRMRCRAVRTPTAEAIAHLLTYGYPNGSVEAAALWGAAPRMTAPLARDLYLTRALLQQGRGEGDVHTPELDAILLGETIALLQQGVPAEWMRSWM